jgi:hypothetical protein
LLFPFTVFQYQDNNDTLNKTKPTNTKKNTTLICCYNYKIRDIPGVDSSGLSDPFVRVTIGGTNLSRDTRIIHGCTSAVFDDEFIFPDVQLPANEYAKSTIKIQVYDANIIFRNELLGQFAFQISKVREQQTHQFYRTWVVLAHPDAPGSPRGFLKCTVTVLGKGDAPPSHRATLVTEPTLETLRAASKFGAEAKALVTAPQTRRRGYNFIVKVLRAEHLVKECDSFLVVRFNGVVSRTPTKQRSRSPDWSYQVCMAVFTPIYSDTVEIELWEEQGAARPDVMLASTTLSFSTILAQEYGPTWFNFYGTSPEESGFSSWWSSMIRAGQLQATSFIGRALLSLSANLTDLPKRDDRPCPPLATGETETYALFADVFRVTDVQVPPNGTVKVELRFGPNENIRETEWVSPEKTKDGRTIIDFTNHSWNSKPIMVILPKISGPDDPEKITSQLYDIVLSVYTKNILGFIERVGFVRIKTIEAWSFRNDPETHALKGYVATSTGFSQSSGFILAALNFDTLSELQKARLSSSPTNPFPLDYHPRFTDVIKQDFQIRAYIYSARDVPSTNEGGIISKCHVTVSVGPQKLTVNNQTIIDEPEQIARLLHTQPTRLNQFNNKTSSTTTTTSTTTTGTGFFGFGTSTNNTNPDLLLKDIKRTSYANNTLSPTWYETLMIDSVGIPCKNIPKRPFSPCLAPDIEITLYADNQVVGVARIPLELATTKFTRKKARPRWIRLAKHDLTTLRYDRILEKSKSPLDKNTGGFSKNEMPTGDYYAGDLLIKIQALPVNGKGSRQPWFSRHRWPLIRQARVQFGTIGLRGLPPDVVSSGGGGDLQVEISIPSLPQVKMLLEDARMRVSGIITDKNSHQQQQQQQQQQNNNTNSNNDEQQQQLPTTPTSTTSSSNLPRGRSLVGEDMYNALENVMTQPLDDDNGGIPNIDREAKDDHEDDEDDMEENPGMVILEGDDAESDYLNRQRQANQALGFNTTTTTTTTYDVEAPIITNINADDTGTTTGLLPKSNTALLQRLDEEIDKILKEQREILITGGQSKYNLGKIDDEGVMKWRGPKKTNTATTSMSNMDNNSIMDGIKLLGTASTVTTANNNDPSTTTIIKLTNNLYRELPEEQHLTFFRFISIPVNFPVDPFYCPLATIRVLKNNICIAATQIPLRQFAIELYPKDLLGGKMVDDIFAIPKMTLTHYGRDELESIARRDSFNTASTQSQPGELPDPPKASSVDSIDDDSPSPVGGGGEGGENLGNNFVMDNSTTTTSSNFLTGEGHGFGLPSQITLDDYETLNMQFEPEITNIGQQQQHALTNNSSSTNMDGVDLEAGDVVLSSSNNNNNINKDGPSNNKKEGITNYDKGGNERLEIEDEMANVHWPLDRSDYMGDDVVPDTLESTGFMKPPLYSSFPLKSGTVITGSSSRICGFFKTAIVVFDHQQAISNGLLFGKEDEITDLSRDVLSNKHLHDVLKPLCISRIVPVLGVSQAALAFSNGNTTIGTGSTNITMNPILANQIAAQYNLVMLKKNDEEVDPIVHLSNGVKNIKVRVYVVQALDLWASNPQTVKPYLKVRTIVAPHALGKFNGKTSMDDSHNVKLGNSPFFGSWFELDARFPDVSFLEIAVWDKGSMMGDTLIGITMIDLEDRWYNPTWQNTKANRRFIKEFRTLTDMVNDSKSSMVANAVTNSSNYAQTASPARGKLELWVEMYTPREVVDAKIADIRLPRSDEWELRLVIWETRGVPPPLNSNSISLYVTGEMMYKKLDNTWAGEQYLSTDTHYNVRTGAGLFNWRMKFDLQVPCKFPRLNLKVWSTEWLSIAPNEAVGVAIVDLDFLASLALAKRDDIPIERPRTLVKIITSGGTPRGELDIQISLVRKRIAMEDPVGLGRELPNKDPFLPEPKRENFGFFAFLKSFSLYRCLCCLILLAIPAVALAAVFAK